MKFPSRLRAWWKRRIVADGPSKLTEEEIDELLDEIAAAERKRHKHVFDSDNGVEIAAEIGLVGIYCSCGEIQVHEMQRRESGEIPEEV